MRLVDITPIHIMNTIKRNESCSVCSKQFNYSNNSYEGAFIPKYKKMICKTCYTSNWDGWVGKNEEVMLAGLSEDEKNAIIRTEDGVLPRD